MYDASTISISGFEVVRGLDKRGRATRTYHLIPDNREHALCSRPKDRCSRPKDRYTLSTGFQAAKQLCVKCRARLLGNLGAVKVNGSLTLFVPPNPHDTDENRFLDLHQKAKLLRNSAKVLQKEADRIAGEIIDRWSRDGVQNVTTRGHLVYQDHRWSVGIKTDDPESHKIQESEHERSCRLLRNLGLDWLVHERADSRNLAGHIRELEDEGDENLAALVEALQAGFVAKEVTSLRVKATSKTRRSKNNG